MSAKEEAFKNEFQFASSSIVAHIVRGVLVGIVVGCIVSSFRFLIEHIFHFVQGVYKEMSGQPLYLAGDAVGVWGDRTDCWSPSSHQSGYQGIGIPASRSRAQGPLGGELVGYPVEEVYSRCLGHRKWLDAWS